MTARRIAPPIAWKPRSFAFPDNLPHATSLI